MRHVNWTHRPEVDAPVLIIAFEGWNDAGDAASSALRYLRDRWDATAFAEIDPEEFFDFTDTRPEVTIDENDRRTIQWPSNTFYAGVVPETGQDVLLLLGTEPQLRWRTFSHEIIDVARDLGAEMVITFGALLAEVAHSRPTAVVGTSHDVTLQARLGLRRSSYQGPTGIVGVLHSIMTDQDVPTASLWATVPTYVPGAQSPKATLALVERAAAILDTTLVTTDLEIAASAYERQINELVEEDEETSQYVAALEDRHDNDDDFPTGVSLVEEVERFLREHRDD